MKRKSVCKSTPKRIQIGRRQYKLFFDKKATGGMFNTRYPKDGSGRMILGLKWTDPEEVYDTLIHEVLEALLVEDQKRYRDPGAYGDGERMVFVFDHDYLCELSYGLAAALRSVGALDTEVIQKWVNSLKGKPLVRIK